MDHTKIRNSFFGIILLLFIGCEGEVGPQGIGLNSLTNVTNEPAGTNCENGGVKIEVGTDTNENGALDSDEVVSTSYVCNGVDGATSLTVVTTEPSGTNCENGGLKIDSGVDSNGDGTLDNTEISTTAYVCNGIDGNNSLTKISNEAAGTNCENGGLKIDSGIDANADGTLDDTEISATAYVCNGIDGNNSLTKITNESAGTNCENGGLKIDTGVDSNSDGTLDDSEVSVTAYACNGLNGNVSLVNITDEIAGTNCENGGIKIDSGVDDDSDGILDEEEIEVSRYICNGVDGGFDEQIRLTISTPVSSSAWGLITNSMTYEFAGIGLPEFDKRDYIDVDSIVFSSNPWSSSGATAFLELYDATNDISISNSEISATQSLSEREFVYSQNIFMSLPDQRINLGFRVRSSTGDNLASGNPILILFRSN